MNGLAVATRLRPLEVTLCVPASVHACFAHVSLNCNYELVPAFLFLTFAQHFDKPSEHGAAMPVVEELIVARTGG